MKKTQFVLVLALLVMGGFSFAPAVWVQETSSTMVFFDMVEDGDGNKVSFFKSSEDSLVCLQSKEISAGIQNPEVWGFWSGPEEFASIVWVEEEEMSPVALGAFNFGFLEGPAYGFLEDGTWGQLQVSAVRPVGSNLHLLPVSPEAGKKPATLPVARFRSLFSSDGTLASDTLRVVTTLLGTDSLRIVTEVVCREDDPHVPGGAWCDVVKGLFGEDIIGRTTRGIVYDKEEFVVGYVNGGGINPPCGRTSLSVEDIVPLLTEIGIHVAVEEDGELPTELSLTGNYPNPFNQQTTIRFAVPELGPVRLVVYDLLGRQVAVLVDGVRAIGTHEASFDGSGLPSGIYLYRLETLRGVEARRMVLMR